MLTQKQKMIGLGGLKVIIAVLLLLPSNSKGSPTLETSPDDNSLWRSISNCKDMSLDCMKKEFVGYLQNVFDAKDVRVSSFLNFRKNDVDYSAFNIKLNQSDSNQKDDEDDNEDIVNETSRAANPLEEVTSAVQDKIKEFFVTHDVHLFLPEFIAEGASVRISPRAFQDGGALVKLDLTNENIKDVEERSASVGTPRIFFKKIRKFIGERLMWALAALVLVVKLLSLKFMFFLPVIMGVAAAKKLLLKVILFVFPFLGHLFKLCPYYAPTKYHHHHHQISHLHHLPPHLHDIHAGGVELDHPPPGWSESDHDHHPHYHHGDNHGEYTDDLGYYSDGPGFGAQEIGLRRKQQLNQNAEDDGYPNQGYPSYPPDVKPYRPKVAAPKTPSPIKNKAGPISAAEIENMVLKAEKEAMLKARLQEEQKRVEVENKRLQDKIKNSLKLQEKLKIQSLVAKQTSKIAAAYQPPPPPPHQPAYIGPYVPQQVALPHAQAIYAPVAHHQPVFNNPTVLSAMQTQLQSSASNSLNSLGTYGKPAISGNSMTGATTTGNVHDPFYSPILQKIDKIFNELLILDETCRERLVCNMYSEPEKYSPHSNLISAELSRDASELQKPTTSNSAVIRFYKYVQAARDGQDKRTCSTLYPACTLSL